MTTWEMRCKVALRLGLNTPWVREVLAGGNVASKDVDGAVCAVGQDHRLSVDEIAEHRGQLVDGDRLAEMFS